MTTRNHTDATAVLAKILEALANLRYGSVEITVHEGRIVQIERKEKLRLNLPLSDNNGNTADGGH